MKKRIILTIDENIITPFFLLKLLMIGLAILIAACSTVTVEPIKLNYDPSLPTKYKIKVTDVTIEEGGIRNDYAGALFHAFDFNNENINYLRFKLENAISSVSRGENKPVMRVSVKVMRYYQLLTNQDAAALARIEWQATSSGDDPIFKEVFYVSYYSKPKIDLHLVEHLQESIVNLIANRVAQSSVNLALADSSNKEIPARVKGTFAKYDEAVSSLPESMKGNYVGLGHLGLAPLIVGVALTENSKTAPNWQWVKE